MLDVTALILDDHAQLRARFASFDDAQGVDQLRELWKELADFLDVHATCEEEVFYPHLLKLDSADGEDETDDAIGDHDKIRQAIRAAANKTVGSEGWWAAVGRARKENSEHLAEEEDGALADFRRSASGALRADLAVQWRSWRRTHRPLVDVDVTDKNPSDYIEAQS